MDFLCMQHISKTIKHYHNHLGKRTIDICSQHTSKGINHAVNSDVLMEIHLLRMQVDVSL